MSQKGVVLRNKDAFLSRKKDLALRDGYTTGTGLGMGLGGARRLVNEFAIESAPGNGTRVSLTRWR